MVLAGGALVLVELLLVVYCVLSVVTTPADQVRHLPKAAWLLLVVVLPLAGGVAWLLSGRSSRPSSSLPSPGRDATRAHDRPGRARASAPDDDAAFLQQLRDRAEAQRARREAAEQDEDRRPGEPS